MDKLLGAAARPGTSPVVNRVRKSDYNRISSQIRDYQHKLKEIRALQELDGNSFDHEYGSAEVTRRKTVDRAHSSNRTTAELKKVTVDKLKSSHDAT